MTELDKIFIKALGKVVQEPCDDTISREDAEECKELMTDMNGDTVYAVRQFYMMIARNTRQKVRNK